MRIGKRMLAAVLAIVMTLGGSVMTSYASDQKITIINLEIKNEIKVGQPFDSSGIRVYNKTSKYSATDVTITNSGFEWGPDDVPTVDVKLEAESGFYFSVLAKDVNVKGATVVNAQKIDSTHLLLSLKLPALNEQAGEIVSAGWSSDTVASWSESANAGYYEVKLYREGVNVKLTQTTKTNSLDMAPCMTKAGYYVYKVRAVNKIKDDNKSDWVDSTEIHVSNELAAKNREQYGNLNTGAAEPGQEPDPSTLPAGWVQDTKGWWYRNQGDFYTTNDWQLIDDKWYYFDSNGYMVTGWIQWNDKMYFCDLAGGHMLTSCLTPDGKRVDSQGVLFE